MKKISCLILFFLVTIVSFSETLYIKGKILSVVNKEDVKDDSMVSSITNFKVQLLDGKEKGKVVLISHPTYKEDQFNIDIKKNSKVVISSDSESYYIIEKDRRSGLYILGFLFLGLTLIITKKQGLKALLSLGITGFLIFKFMIPLIIQGFSPIIVAVVVSCISTLFTIFFITGISKKGIIAILGTLGGIVFSGILSLIFSKYMGLTGYTSMESINYAILIQNIKLKELVSAGIIIGTTGAVMDVGVSISSALTEVCSHNPKITPRGIFKSGMKIGGDIIGTMVNTLILAYIGSSLFTILILTIQQGDYPSIRIFNFEFIVVEFLKGFCGSIGIILCVPLTSFLYSMSRNEKSK